MAIAVVRILIGLTHGTCDAIIIAYQNAGLFAASTRAILDWQMGGFFDAR
jgi:hypothetical protein